MTTDDFMIAVLPDTQFYSQSFPSTFNAQTQWIADNREAHNIAFVSHLGDIVQSGESGSNQNLTQWQRADAAMDILDGNLSGAPDGLIPYSAVLGNHDYRIISDKLSGTTRYQQFFGPSRYLQRSWYVEDSQRVGAHAQIFEAGGYRFLNIALQFEPLDADLTWAQSIIDRHPGLPTIFSTHSYLNPNTSERQVAITGNTGGVPNPGNAGESLFQKFVSVNPQVFLTLNGHYSGEYTQISKNVVGQDVIEMVVDYQSRANGGDGWMRLLEFHPEESRIDVKTFSPTRNEYETDADSQFSIPFPFLERFGPAELNQETTSVFQEGRVNGGSIYTATRDTQLRQNAPSTAGTTAQALLVDAAENGVANASHSLLSFDAIFGNTPGLIPLGAQILEAKLVLETTNPGAGAKLHRMIGAWNENATWNSIGSGIQANSLEASAVFNSQVGVSTLTPIVPVGRTEVDVTSDLQAWANGATNHGWALMPWSGGTDGWAFASSEATRLDDRPRLSVQWLAPQTGNLAPALTSDNIVQTYIEDGPAINLFASATMADIDSINFDDGTLRIEFEADASVNDRLELQNQGNGPGQVSVSGTKVYFSGVPVGTVGGGVGLVPLSIRLNAAADVPTARSLLRSVTYRHLSDAPVAGTRVVNARVWDGDGGVSNLIECSVSIIPVNDGPTISGIEPSIRYAAGGGSVAIAPRAAITDPDSSAFNGGSLIVTLSATSHESDALSIRNDGSLTGRIGVSGTSVTLSGQPIGIVSGGTSGSPLQVTWTTSVTPQTATAVLRNVLFTTADRSLTPMPRLVEIRASDDQGTFGQQVNIDIVQSQAQRLVFQQDVDHGFGLYSGAADIELSQANPTTPFPVGSNPSTGFFVDFDNAGENKHTLLRFSSIIGNGLGQVPPGSTIVSADLILETSDPGDGATLHRMLIDWNSNTSTWNSLGNGVQPDGIEAMSQYESQTGTLSGNGDTRRGQTIIGVRSDLQAWANGQANFGWLLTGWNGLTNGWGFNPSEAANENVRPKLVVQWVPSSIPTVNFRQGENGYTATVDTMLQQASPSESFANSTFLFTDAPSPEPTSATVLNDESQTLIRFDDIVGPGPNQIPSGSIIHAATLRLASTSSNAPGNGARMMAMKQPWPAASTWSSTGSGIQADGIEAASTPTVLAGGSGNGRVDGGWNTFDVTSDIQSWTTGQATNRGWAFLPHEGGIDGWGVQSSETPEIRLRPQLSVSYTAPSIQVAPTSGLMTSEDDTTTTFSIVLTTRPTSDVVIPISSSDPTEGMLEVSSVVFTPNNWFFPQAITVTGVADGIEDGDVAYSIITAAAASDDVFYHGMDAADINAVNRNVFSPQPPKVDTIVFADGTNQRSMVNRITVHFDSKVETTASAFKLERRSGGAFVAIPNSELAIFYSDIGDANQTIARLTFTGSSVIGGSLPDGYYRLTLLAEQITSSGMTLVGNGDGIAGGNYVKGEAEVDAFFRRFGDTNGNRTTTIAELGQARLALNRRSPDPHYNAAFDANNDGIVSIAELGQVRLRLNRRLPF